MQNHICGDVSSRVFEYWNASPSPGGDAHACASLEVENMGKCPALFAHLEMYLTVEW